MRDLSVSNEVAVIKVDLLDIENSCNQPQLRALFQQGWEVVSSLPVEDEGKPVLILMLREKPKAYRSKLVQVMPYKLALILIFEILIFVHLFMNNPV